MSVDILRTSWDQCRSMVQYSFTSMETRRLMRTDSPGRPPWLSHSSWTMMLEPKLIVILYKTELLWTWCVCENMFNIFLFQEKLSVAAFSYTHVCSCPKWQTVEEISSKWGGWGAKLFSVLDPMESCDAVPRRNSNSALYPCTALAAFPWAGVGMECLFSVYTPPPLHKLVLVWGVCFQSSPPPPPSRSNFNGGTQLFLQDFHCNVPQRINCFCFLRQIPDLLGTPMTFSLFEWVKDNLDSLLEHQPDAPLPQVCIGSRCPFHRSLIIPFMFTVQILESRCHLCVCHAVGIKNKTNKPKQQNKTKKEKS